MKTYGNIILMTVICIVLFWVFMALRPANATFFPGPSGSCCNQFGEGGQMPQPQASPRKVKCFRAIAQPPSVRNAAIGRCIRQR